MHRSESLVCFQLGTPVSDLHTTPTIPLSAMCQNRNRTPGQNSIHQINLSAGIPPSLSSGNISHIPPTKVAQL